MLLISPELAHLADVECFRAFAAVATPEFPSDEVELVLALLEIGIENPNIRVIAERFRGSRLEPLVTRFQASSLIAWEGGKPDQDALKTGFLGAWQLIEQRLSKARIDALLEKSRKGTLSEEDKALYRQLISSGASGSQASAR
jgi:hypothetical protein